MRAPHALLSSKRLGSKLLASLAGGLLLVMLSGVLAMVQTKRLIEQLGNEAEIYDKNERIILKLQVNFKEQIQEWKNVLLRGNDPDLLEKYWSAFERQEQQVKQEANALLPSLEKSAAKPNLQRFIAAHEQMSADYRRAFATFNKTGHSPRAGDALIRGVDRAPLQELAQAAQIISGEADAFDERIKKEAWKIAATNFLLIFVAVLAGVIPFLAALNKHVVKPLRGLSEFAHRFAKGERNRRLTPRAQDEIGEVIEAFNYASTEIEKLVTDLKASETQYRNLLDGIDAIVWVLNPATQRFVFVSESAATLLGYSATNWIASKNFFATYVHPDDRERTAQELAAVSHKGTGELEHRAIRADGKSVWVHNRIRVIKDRNGETRLLGVLVDLSKLKEAEAQTEYLATHDKLTALPNRNLLKTRLLDAIATARDRDTHVGLMVVNIDRFKTLNESLGHEMGDEAIKQVAARLAGSVSHNDTVARLGSDEFAIVVDGLARPESLADTAYELLKTVAQPLEIKGRRLTLTCTIGICLYPNDGLTGEELLKNAGVALSLAKAQGRNRFHYYTEDANAKALERLTIENALRNATEQNELLLHYQPQVEIKSGTVIGVEALLRWKHPEFGLVPPAEFIPLAEETGTILQIGDWVLREACQQAKHWQAQGHTSICVGVNVSAQQFVQPDFVERVAAALSQAALDPQYLEIEITESVVMHDVESIIETLHALKSLGVKLAIDDFGTGYSSLSYLKRFPIDKLKIDRSFVKEISTDPNSAAIVSAIIALSQRMGLRVIAEGVEEAQQLAYLQALHCDEAQGYYFSKPVDAASLSFELARPLTQRAV